MSRTFLEQTAIEFGPLTLFFFVSWVWGFYPGATALVISTLIAMAYSLYRFRRFAVFSFTVSTLVLLCGTATVWLHEPEWIVLEYTISNLAFGIATLVSYLRGHPLLKDFFSHMFHITDKGWMTLTLRWSIVFIIAGISNQAYWEIYNDPNDWTLFRFVSTLAIFAFGISQFYLSKRERMPDSSPWGLKL
jgi:intracellular septation protein